MSERTHRLVPPAWRRATVSAFTTALVLNLVDAVAGPTGAWWTAVRAAASAIFTVAAVGWLVVWLRRRP